MLLPLFEWIETTSLTAALRTVDWYGAMINVAHLLALVVFFGGLFVVDLRLMGTGMTKQPLRQVAREARPWLIGGFLGLVLTGIPQVMLQPIKEYYSDIFWIKMDFLAVAIIYTLTVRRMATQADEARLGLWGKLVGVVSIALWLGVAINARLIGLLS